MKILIIGLAAICLGTAGLPSSASVGSESAQARLAPSSAFGFPAIGTAGRWAGSPV